jgi:hypothetical protein
MSSLYFGLDINCQFKVRDPELDTVYNSTAVRGRGCMSISETLASDIRRQLAQNKIMISLC